MRGQPAAGCGSSRYPARCFRTTRPIPNCASASCVSWSTRTRQPARLGACDEADEIVGVCRVVAEDCPRTAGDIAIVVADHAQGTGVGRTLLTRLLEEAARAGFGMVSALILKDNLRARELFTSTAERLALPYRMERATGVVELRISLAPLRGPADPLLP